MIEQLLVLAGVLALIAFVAVLAALAWPPLALLALGVTLVPAGLVIDWEEMRDQPDPPPPS